MNEEFTAIQKFVEMGIEFAVNYGFQAIGAVVILILGMFFATRAARMILGVMQKKDIDITLSKFSASVVKILIISFAVIIALGKFGITIAPFIAAVGAAAFGASFALQGPLSNYGAGLVIIMTRPFTVGNTISVAGVSGVVEEIRLATTLLTDEEGELITIPNKSIIGEILHNSLENKIVQGSIGISYDSDPERAISAIRSVLAAYKEVTTEKDPIVGIENFGDSSINIGFRYWVPTTKYYAISYVINLSVFKALKENGIVIPFPQREIKILSNT